MIRVATLISKLFEPAVLLSVSILLCSVKMGLSLVASGAWLMLLIGPVIAYRLWAKSKGLDWDIHDRQKRIKPFLMLLGYLVVAGIIVWIGEPRLMPLVGLFVAWTTGFFIITLLWTKISGHVGGDTLAIGMILRWCGYVWWPLVLIIPVVAWARVVRKDHTVIQVIIGAVYSVVVLLLL